MKRITLQNALLRDSRMAHAVQLDARVLTVLQQAEQYRDITTRWQEYERLRASGWPLIGDGAYHHALQKREYYEAFVNTLDLLLPDVDDEHKGERVQIRRDEIGEEEE